MAEFAEVMRQAKRMCDYCGCGECPLDNGEVCRLGTDHDGEDYSDVERIVMEWAKEHPSWEDAVNTPCPNDCFGEEYPEDMDCTGCRWIDKNIDEEPCKNCCGVMGGSAPDLWEKE